MYVPMPILKALYQVMPERVLAEGSGAVWTMQIQGRRPDGEAFTSSMFNYSGGMGARATKSGPSATCYPTGVAAVPIEILEAAMPIVFDRKELRRGSGGAGRTRGGDGQTIAFHLRTREPWLLNAVPSRMELGPEGIGGGLPGKPGRFLVNGAPVSVARKLVMAADDTSCWKRPAGAASARHMNQQKRPGRDEGMRITTWTTLALAGALCAGTGMARAQDAYKVGISAGLTATPRPSTAPGATACSSRPTRSTPRAAWRVAESR